MGRCGGCWQHHRLEFLLLAAEAAQVNRRQPLARVEEERPVHRLPLCELLIPWVRGGHANRCARSGKCLCVLPGGGERAWCEERMVTLTESSLWEPAKVDIIRHRLINRGNVLCDSQSVVVPPLPLPQASMRPTQHKLRASRRCSVAMAGKDACKVGHNQRSNAHSLLMGALLTNRVGSLESNLLVHFSFSRLQRGFCGLPRVIKATLGKLPLPPLFPRPLPDEKHAVPVEYCSPRAFAIWKSFPGHDAGRSCRWRGCASCRWRGCASTRQ
jgi:hypothetical protein